MDFGILDIIPRPYRRRGLWVAATIFVRAVLNFLGLALLLPVLLLLLDTDSIRSDRYLSAVYDWGGFADERSFVCAVCAAAVGVIVVKCLASMALYRSERDYVYALYACLSRRLYVHYHDRGLGFLKNANSAVLMRNVNVVCLAFVTGVLRPMAAIVGEAMLFLLLLGALAVYDPTAALLTLAVFLPAGWLYYRMIRNRLGRYGDLENQAHRLKARIVTETFRGYPDIEIGNAFPSMLRRFDEATHEIVRTRSKEATLSVLPQMITEIGLGAGMVLLVLVGMDGGGERMRILFGIFAVGALRLMPSVRSVMSSWASIKFNRYTLDVLREVDLDREEPLRPEDAERLPLRCGIDVEHLTFRFADADRDTLHDVSFTVRKGERVGIRGASGSGKTTLFNLLLGFYAPTSGRILIDGVPLTDGNRRRWQNTVGYVSQNVFIADGTLLENVALGLPAAEIDRARADRAFASARMKEFIDTLPLGMDTPIGECGCRLSGGQRQRIGIARALYKQADVLLFDEATSSLDSRTEEEVNRSIEALSAENRELTIIVIAHRDSSLEYCDRIITTEE